MSLQNILDGVSRLEGYRGLFYEGFLADCDIEDTKELFEIIGESVAIISDLLEVAKCAKQLLKVRDQYGFDELQRAMEKLDGLDERSDLMNGRDGPTKARAILFGDNLIYKRMSINPQKEM
jgi:hypothetical protein